MYSSNGHANEVFVWLLRSRAAFAGYGIRARSEPTYSACHHDDVSRRSLEKEEALRVVGSLAL